MAKQNPKRRTPLRPVPSQELSHHIILARLTRLVLAGPSQFPTSRLVLARRRGNGNLVRLVGVLAVLAIPPDAPKAGTLDTRDDDTIAVPDIHGERYGILLLARLCVAAAHAAHLVLHHDHRLGVVQQRLGFLVVVT